MESVDTKTQNKKSSNHPVILALFEWFQITFFICCIILFLSTTIYVIRFELNLLKMTFNDDCSYIGAVENILIFFVNIVPLGQFRLHYTCYIIKQIY
jgi:hypothetical protein